MISDGLTDASLHCMQVEHDVANPNQPECPPSHPRFLFHLGGNGPAGLMTREHFVPRTPPKPQFVARLGYVSLFPLLLRLLPPDAPQLPSLLDLLGDPATLWSPHGLRSLAREDAWYARENAPGDAPYWRGPIWVNLNYLALAGLHHYGAAPGPSQERAAKLYSELRDNLVGTMIAEWERTGYLWEQYDPETGRGQRTHPFNGWSSLALLALAEIY
jgi:mannosyl-oligosaccharide glucosidase